MFFFIRQHQAEQQLLLDQLCAEMFNNLLNSASGSTVGLIKHEGASINQSESRTVTSKQQRSKQKLTESSTSLRTASTQPVFMVMIVFFVLFY